MKKSPKMDTYICELCKKSNMPCPTRCRLAFVLDLLSPNFKSIMSHFLILEKKRQTNNYTCKKRHKHETKTEVKSEKKSSKRKFFSMPSLRFVTVVEKAPKHVPYNVNVGLWVRRDTCLFCLTRSESTSAEKWKVKILRKFNIYLKLFCTVLWRLRNVNKCVKGMKVMYVLLYILEYYMKKV